MKVQPIYGVDSLDLMNREQLEIHASKLGLEVSEGEADKVLADRIYAVEAQIPPYNPEKEAKAKKLPDPEKRAFLVQATPEEVTKALEAHINVGMEIVSMDDEQFHFRFNKKEDSGTMKQPLKRIVQCANALVQAG